MGNTNSTSTSSRSRRGRSSPETATERAKKVVGDIHDELRRSVKKLDDDHPAAQLIDSVCGGYFDEDKYRQSRSASFYSEEISEDGSRTVSEDDATYDDRSRSKKDATSVESSSCMSQSDYESEPKHRRGRRAASSSFDTEEDSKHVPGEAPLLSKPLASSFAKRCYFTKSGIGKTTQHYEGLTLTGNIVLMLAAAMKLKGCPTICDEDLRRVEQTYPNQFSRLPDELLLSSGWRRISKYCHFSNKPIPDGIPFFHSKQRLHPSGGYYFLLAAAVGMVRPIDVEPLTRDTLVLLETDFPTQCDSTPDVLIHDPDQWTLVDKFCFFSGGPINTEEDVYYQADFDGNPIFMLAFLSPSLTPEELYKLGETGEPGLKSSTAVQEVESVYDLTERDFDDLKLYHLGPCRALPQYILQPEAWTKVLPPHFLAARQTAMLRAKDFELRHGTVKPQSEVSPEGVPLPLDGDANDYYDVQWPDQQNTPTQDRPAEPEGHEDKITHHPPEQHISSEDYYETESNTERPLSDIQREVEEEGAFIDASAPMDEAIASRYPLSPPGKRTDTGVPSTGLETPKMDPPEDEPPSLTKRKNDEGSGFPETDEAHQQFFPEQQTFNDQPNPQNPTVPQAEGETPGEFHEGETGNYYEGSGKNEGQEQDYYRSEEPYYDAQAPENQGDAAYYSQNDQYQSPPDEGQYQPGSDYPTQDGQHGVPSDGYIMPSDGQYMSPQNDVYNTGDEMNYQNPAEGHYDEAVDDRFKQPPPDMGYSQQAPDDAHYSQQQSEDPRYAQHPAEDYQQQQPAEDYHYQQQSADDFHYQQQQPADGFHYQQQQPADGFHYQQQPGADEAHLHPTGDHQDRFQMPGVEYPMSSPRDEYQIPSGEDEFAPDNAFYDSEEKKVGADETDPKVSMGKKSPLTVDVEEEFTPIKREGYTLGRAPSPSPRSLASKTSDGGSSALSSSSALRAAQDQLRRNRRRRMEMAMKAKNRQDSPRGYTAEENPAATPQVDDESSTTWESAGSELTASVISGSSVWTDGSNPTDRSSRRALILQMAKARMKSNKEQPNSSTPKNATIQEELPDDGQQQGSQNDVQGGPVQDSNLEISPDIDFTGDLD